jgi:hypothetical protein
MARDPPTKPPKHPEKMLHDISRYLIEVEGKDPEEVAEQYEEHAKVARKIGPGWAMDYDRSGNDE